MNPPTIGQIICEHRKKNGLTQKALAAMLNVTDKAVSKWERDIARPDINTVPKLAETLGIPVEVLLNIPIHPQPEDEATQVSSPRTTAVPPASPETESIPFAIVESADMALPAIDTYMEEWDFEREEHKETSKSLLLTGLVGFLIGVLLGITALPISESPAPLLLLIIMGFAFSGVIYGWKLFGRILDGWFIMGSLPILIIAFGLRLAGSMLIGWIAYPIALLYNLAKAQRKKSFGRGFLFSLLGLFIAALSALAVFIMIQTFTADDSDDTFQDYVSATTSAYVSNPSVLGPSAFDLQAICNDSLEAALADVEVSSGIEILTQPSLNTAYFLCANVTGAPHTEYGHNISLHNALMVVTSYEDRLLDAVERTNVTIWVYPNFTADSDGSVSYEKAEEYTYYLNCDDLSEVYEWLASEFSDMSITELLILN